MKIRKQIGNRIRIGIKQSLQDRKNSSILLVVIYYSLFLLTGGYLGWINRQVFVQQLLDFVIS